MRYKDILFIHIIKIGQMKDDLTPTLLKVGVKCETDLSQITELSYWFEMYYN